MATKCPKCQRLVSLNYTKSDAEELARRGELKAYCIHCDYSWTPVDQQEILTRLKNLPEF